MGWRLLVTTLLEREDGRRRGRAVSPAFRRKGQLRRQPGYKTFFLGWVIKWSSCTRLGRGPLHLPATHFPVAADTEGCHAASRGLGGRSSVTLPS